MLGKQGPSSYPLPTFVPRGSHLGFREPVNPHKMVPGGPGAWDWGMEKMIECCRGVSTCGESVPSLSGSRCAAGRGAGVGRKVPQVERAAGTGGRGKRGRASMRAQACAFHPLIAPLLQDVVGNAFLLIPSLERSSHLT